MPEFIRFANLTDEQTEVGALFDMAVRRGRPAWMLDALCLEHPEVNFFPRRGEDVRPAKKLCASCLAYWPCQEWSLSQPAELEGIWGGLSGRDRAKLRAGRTERVW